MRRDLNLEMQRIEFEQVLLTPFGRAQGTHLVNYKENAQWMIDIDAAGKAVCTKEKQPPGPQPSGDDCFASSAVPLRRGTQGPFEVTWWAADSGKMGNLTIAAAGTNNTLAKNMLHYGELIAIVSSARSSSPRLKCTLTQPNPPNRIRNRMKTLTSTCTLRWRTTARTPSPRPCLRCPPSALSEKCRARPSNVCHV